MDRAGSEGAEEFSSCHRSVNKRSICRWCGRAEALCAGLAFTGPHQAKVQRRGRPGCLGRGPQLGDGCREFWGPDVADTSTSDHDRNTPAPTAVLGAKEASSSPSSLK